MLRLTSDVYLFAFMGASALILLQIMLYTIQLLKDLERHYIVMQEGCREVNQMYLIRGFFHLLPTFVLFGMQYFNLFLFNLPANMLTWHNIDRCFNVDQAADPEVIRKQLFKCKMYALFFFLSFFIYMYLLAVRMCTPTVVIRLTESS